MGKDMDTIQDMRYRIIKRAVELGLIKRPNLVEIGSILKGDKDSLFDLRDRLVKDGFAFYSEKNKCILYDKKKHSWP